jgi:hypothetical protein
MIFDCQPERHRRVHCIWFVGRPVSHTRTILVKLRMSSLGRSKMFLAGVNLVAAAQRGQVTRKVVLGSRREITEYGEAKLNSFIIF